MTRARRTAALALGLLCLAQFLVVLDTSIVNVALPAIGRDLDVDSPAQLQYVISWYALTFGGLLIVAGRATDLFGRRRLFVTGLTVFTVMSMACGLAPTPAVLLTARACQGVGSALVSSAALALLTSHFAEGRARHRALGAWGAVGGAAGASGLLLGGFLTDVAGWPWIFLINVPLGLGAVFAAPRLLPSDRGDTSAFPDTPGLDLPGALTVTAGLALLIFGLSRSEQRGLVTASTLGVLAGAALLLTVFVLLERRSHHPLVTARLVRTPGVVAANVAMLTVTAIVASNLFFTTLYVQRVLGFSPWRTGLAFVPNSVLVVAGSAIATRLAGRLQPAWILTAGFTLLGVAGLLLGTVTPDGRYLTDVLPGFALTGLGLGLATVAATLGATHGVARSEQGLASGLVNSAQQLGFAVGIAAVATAAAALAPAAADAGAGSDAVGSDAAGADATGAVLEASVDRFAIGYRLDAVLAAAGVLAALALARTRRASRHGPSPES